MAWPTDLSKVSTDLPGDEFTLVRMAIDLDLVEWNIKEGMLFNALGNYPFIFNGHEYVMSEYFEVVQSINRKEKK